MSIKKVKRLEVDLAKRRMSPALEFYSGDEHTAIIEFEVLRNKQEVNLEEEGITAELHIKSKDGNYLIGIPKISDDNKSVLIYELNDDVLLRAGHTVAELKLIVGNEEASVLRMDIDIKLSLEDEALKSLPTQDDAVKKMIIDLIKSNTVPSEQTESQGQSDWTYEQAKEMGLADWINDELFVYLADEMRQNYQNELKNTIRNVPLYNDNEFLFTMISDMKNSVDRLNSYSGTLGYGILPETGGNAEGYNEWRVAKTNEDGIFNGNFIEYMWLRMVELEQRVAELEQK